MASTIEHQMAGVWRDEEIAIMSPEDIFKTQGMA